jgi:hypothetical protein
MIRALIERLRRYRRDRRWRRLFAYGAKRARDLGLTEEDLPRLIAESRQERAAERIRELRKGNTLPDGVTVRSLIDDGRA